MFIGTKIVITRLSQLIQNIFVKVTWNIITKLVNKENLWSEDKWENEHTELGERRDTNDMGIP